MTAPSWSRFKTQKKPKAPARTPEPGRVLTAAEKAALLASRPDLQPPRSRARRRDDER